MPKSDNSNAYNIKGQIVFFIMMAVILLATFLMIRPFIGAIMLAIITAILFQPVYSFFYTRVKKRSTLAVTLTLLSIFVTVFIPLLLFGGLAVAEIRNLRDDLQSIIDQNEISLEVIVEWIKQLNTRFPWLGLDVTEEEISIYITDSIKGLSDIFINRVLTIGLSSLEILVQLFVYGFFLIVLIPSRGFARKFITDLSPMKDSIDLMYIRKSTKMVRSMIKGTLLIALIQTILSSFFLYLAGVEYVIFWSIILLFVAIIPVFGTAIIVIPLGILMIIGGNWPSGLFLILTNIFIVSMVDNILRPIIVSEDTSLNPALVLVSILGGVKFFGPFGFIYGPVLMILAVTTLDVYRKYYRD
jgi:predicted PurR-regulated permease PerM